MDHQKIRELSGGRTGSWTTWYECQYKYYTLQTNDISIVYEGDDDTMTLLNNQYLRQIDQLNGANYDQIFDSN